MKYASFIVLLVLHFPAKAQNNWSSSYLDSAGIRKQGRIRFAFMGSPYDNDTYTHIAISDSGMPFRIFPASSIQEFTFAFGGGKYCSVIYGGKYVFMRVLQDSKHVKR
jgi:hypothetical protein